MGRCQPEISPIYGSLLCPSSCAASRSHVRERFIGCHGYFPVRILASRGQQRNLRCPIVSVDDDRGGGPGTTADLQHQILAGARRRAMIGAGLLPVVLEQLPRTLKVESLAHGKSSPTHSAKKLFQKGLPPCDDCCVDLHFQAFRNSIGSVRVRRGAPFGGFQAGILACGQRGDFPVGCAGQFAGSERNSKLAPMN